MDQGRLSTADDYIVEQLLDIDATHRKLPVFGWCDRRCVGEMADTEPLDDPTFANVRILVRRLSQENPL